MVPQKNLVTTAPIPLHLVAENVIVPLETGVKDLHLIKIKQETAIGCLNLGTRAALPDKEN